MKKHKPIHTMLWTDLQEKLFSYYGYKLCTKIMKVNDMYLLIYGQQLFGHLYEKT